MKKGENGETFVSYSDCQQAAGELARKINLSASDRIYGIPRGGTIPAAILAGFAGATIVDSLDKATIVVDDLIHSGATMNRIYVEANNPNKPLKNIRAFCALFDKRSLLDAEFSTCWKVGVVLDPQSWLVFPWEIDNKKGGADISRHDIVLRMLQAIGEDSSRQGLLETPDRVVKAWHHWFGGYQQNPADVLKTFEDGAEKYDELVLVKNIPVYSHCVVGSTFVETPRGRIPIQDLQHLDWIYTVDPKTTELRLTRCHHPRITQKNAKLVRVYTDNDTVICTPDHRFLTTDGVWIEAQHLTNGIRLCSLYRGYLKAGTKNAVSYYPTLIASRYTRHAEGLLIEGPISAGTGVITEHRFIASVMGYELAGERVSVVHHDDECIWNNTPENVQMLSISEHNKIHQRIKKLANNAVRKAGAAAASGRPEVREKRSKSVKAYWDSLSQEERDYKAMQTSEGRLLKNHLVLGVDSVDRREDVWCMTVPGTHTFFANGMAVHNCEHHLAPFFGVAHVGYIADGKIVGLSKLSRLVDVFAHRLQVQERLTSQIAEALNDVLHPIGVGVVLECRHLCMESRGIKRAGSETTTSRMLGALKENASSRAEFLALIGK